MAESNHHHTNCTDNRSRDEEPSPLPGFFAGLHRMVAAALNTHYGRGENFWASGSYDNVEIHSQLSIEQQLLYLWTNPVKDGLVERPEDWPGVKFLPEDFGRTFRARRPEGAFFGGRQKGQPGRKDPVLGDDWLSELAREEAEARALLEGEQRKNRRRARQRESSLPEVVEFTIHPPPGYEDWPIEDVRQHFRELLNAEVERIHASRRAAGRTRFAGHAAILAQNPRDAAGGTWPTFALNPRIACRGDTQRRVSVLCGLIEWRSTYREAYQGLAAGKRVRFPRGVYSLARFACVSVRRARGSPPRAA